MDSWKLCCLYGPVYIQRKQFFRYRNIEHNKRVAYPLLNAKNEKTKNLCLYDCYLFRQKEQRKVVLFIPRGQSWKFEKKSTRYSRTNSVYSSHRKQWKKFLKTSTFAQSSKTNRALKTMW